MASTASAYCFLPPGTLVSIHLDRRPIPADMTEWASSLSSTPSDLVFLWGLLATETFLFSLMAFTQGMSAFGPASARRPT